MSDIFLKVFENAPPWINDAMTEVESAMAKDGGHDWGLNTSTSKLVYDYISGFEQMHDDGSSQIMNGRLKHGRHGFCS